MRFRPDPAVFSGAGATGLSVRITSSIVGTLQLPVEIACLELTDSLLDAATGSGGASPTAALVSGALPPDAQWPIDLGVRLEVLATLGGTAPVTVRLRKAPADLEEARAILQEALRGASSDARFTQATVLRVGRQLLVRSGLPGETVVLAATPGDAVTAVAMFAWKSFTTVL